MLGAAERAAKAHRRLLIEADRLLEGVALDVLHQRPVERDERQDPALRPGLGHGVIHLPVLVADRRRRRARIVEEDIAGRLIGFPFEEVALVDAIERGLDDAGILAGLDLLFQAVAFGAARDIDEGWQPVKGCKQLVDDRAGLDVSRPADNHGAPDSRLPRLRLSGL